MCWKEASWVGLAHSVGLHKDAPGWDRIPDTKVFSLILLVPHQSGLLCWVQFQEGAQPTYSVLLLWELSIAPVLIVQVPSVACGPSFWTLLYPTGMCRANLPSLQVPSLGSEGLWDLECLQQAGQVLASHRQTCGSHHQETDFVEKQWDVLNLGMVGMKRFWVSFHRWIQSRLLEYSALFYNVRSDSIIAENLFLSILKHF